MVYAMTTGAASRKTQIPAEPTPAPGSTPTVSEYKRITDEIFLRHGTPVVSQRPASRRK